MKKKELTLKTPQIDWHQMTGSLGFRVNNDYLFRALLQTDNDVLKALIASLFHWKTEEITSADIENPIQLGERLNKKLYILDIKVLLNNRYTVNLEMQIINENNWPERSLCYLCRVFDHLNRGDAYTDVKPACQIGFTDFSPFPDHREFYDTYLLTSSKNQNIYTDKFKISVVDLSHIELADEDDKAFHLDDWAKMFKAKTWEELRMLAEKNPAIDEAVTKIHMLTEEEMIRQQMESEEEYYRIQRTREIEHERKMKQAEEMMKQAEETKKQAEETKKQAEETKKQAEETKKQAEETKKQAEETKKQAEEIKKQAADQISYYKSLLAQHGIETE